MKADPLHRCRVSATAWAGVHGTWIDSARHYGRHWHDTFGFGLIEHGAQRSASGRGEVEALAGDVITTNPGEVHDGRPIGGPTRRWRMLYLEPAVMASMASTASGGPLEFARPVIHDRTLPAALRGLWNALDRWETRPQPAETLACEEALVRACSLLASHSTARAPSEPPADLRAVRERLADDLLHPPTLAELATLAGLSRYQLLRRFEKQHGLPPHAWLLQRRIERARQLIGAGVTLAEASSASGFADQSHMTRRFVRQFGYTPGAWQRAMARGAQ
ncbi:MAG TPA: AraC family transcriptional regulator [Albitalea sp.]|nr:AraC family transcriptional regulator [Albitalea sp.]